ncbi:MAG: DUF1810 domain-containing protein [Bacteroidota bacterium]
MSYSNTDLTRFLDAQNKLYLTAISEIKNGKKESQWMWFIFPQLRGLGKSFLSEYYGISDINEANEFMKHPILAKHLIEISELLLVYKRKSAEGILGDLNARKLLSCMTLFSQTENAHPIFQEILDTFFFGYSDQNTLYLMKPKLELVS